MKKKISKKDIKDWEKFLTSNEPLENKDKDLEKKFQTYQNIKKVDLHGCSLKEANLKIENLLNKYHQLGVTKIVVITGKGSRSNNEENPYVSKDLSILKNSVPEFIKNNSSLINIIKKIEQAKIEDGGDGAFYIYLKKIKE